MVKKVHTDIYHKHYLENNLVCIANNMVVYVGVNLFNHQLTLHNVI